MLRHLVRSIPISPGEDESDALAIAYCHLSRTLTACAPRALRKIP
jgi:Holliday junction resolvasome RuvABC endonuclease subunit